jgi:hypothetical protein
MLNLINNNTIKSIELYLLKNKINPNDLIEDYFDSDNCFYVFTLLNKKCILIYFNNEVHYFHDEDILNMAFLFSTTPIYIQYVNIFLQYKNNKKIQDKLDLF